MTSEPFTSVAIGREEAIRRDRARVALGAVGWSIGSSELLFWSFAAGAAFGPAPLILPELVAGALFAFALGMIVSSIAVRRRLENTARVVARVREGRRRRRLVVFDDHITVDDEVLVLARLRNAALTEEMTLELTLVPPEADSEMIVTRSFRGPRPELARARDELRTLRATE